MDNLNKRLQWLDRQQRKHTVLAFPIAIIKKYSEDRGGYQAALLTYYGFLSLFPIILVAITALKWFFAADSHLRQRILTSITNAFPLIGVDLQENLHGFSKTGLPLLIGIFVLIYGLRGAADVYRHTVNNIWRVPEHERSGFWPALGRSLSIITVAAVGFLGSTTLASYAASADHNPFVRLLLVLASALCVFLGFLYATKIALDRKIQISELWVGAAITTFGIILLQNIGAYVIGHELRNFDSLYGTFAVVLGLFFWIYLQSQFIIYAMETTSVRVLRLWPRSLLGDDEKQPKSEQKSG